MKAARRVPRRFGGDEDENGSLEPTLFVKRPSSKPKKPSHLRATFAEIEDEAEGRDADVVPVVVQKPSLKRRVLESTIATDIAHRTAAAQDERPSYSVDYLNELKLSTPQTPSNVSVDLEGGAETSTVPLDISSKFGDSTLAVSISHDDQTAMQGYIPSEAEIREKKERRRRLAREQDYISLADEASAKVEDDSDLEDEGRHRNSHTGIIPAEEADFKSKYGESRLTREDDDLAEGFDEFVEDTGKVTLGRKAAKEQDKQRRKELEEQIRAAQHGYGYGAGISGSEDEGGDSLEQIDKDELQRNAAYEAAQTRKGIHVAGRPSGRDHVSKENRERRRLQLPKTKPVPALSVVIARFADMVKSKEGEIQEKQRRLETLKRESEDVALQETGIRTLLAEAGQKFERLQAGVITPANNADSEVAVTNGSSTDAALDTFDSGTAFSNSTSLPAPADSNEEIEKEEDKDDEDNEKEGSSHIEDPILPPRSFAGMGRAAGDEEDDDDYY